MINTSKEQLSKAIDNPSLRAQTTDDLKREMFLHILCGNMGAARDVGTQIDRFEEACAEVDKRIKPVAQHPFYFTYGFSDTQPFKGGWSVVMAETRQQAIEKFCNYHARAESGCINCADIYTAEEWRKTNIYEHGENRGATLHETIE